MRRSIAGLEKEGVVHGPVLSPVDRISEIVFGLIMALTFTGSLSVVTADRAEVRDMLIGALGCNIPWGLVDGVMYILVELAERSREAVRDGGAKATVTLRDLRGAVGVFLLVFLTTLPVVFPFVVVPGAQGWYLGRHAGRRGWAGGLLMLGIGVVLVWATIALGG